MTNISSLPALEVEGSFDKEGTFEDQPGVHIVEKSMQEIHTVQERVTESLHLEPNSLDAVIATDQALVHIAESNLDSEQTSESDKNDAMNTVVIEAAIEIDHGVEVSRTPIAILELDGRGGDIIQTVARLNETHATLPSGHEAAPLMMAAINKLSEHPAMQDQLGTVEYVEAKTIRSEMTEVQKKAEVIAGLAIEASEFRRSPEIEHAVEGYYKDHELAIDLVGKALRGEKLGDLSEDTITESPLLNKALKDIARLSDDPSRADELRKLSKDILPHIYREFSIGALTMSDEFISQKAAEISELSALANQFDAQYDSDTATTMKKRELENTKLFLQEARAGSRGEIRHAGQLLFHNTSHMADITTQGFQLLSRSAQTVEFGRTNTQTAELNGTSHTNVPHFSELYDPYNYKGIDKTTSRGHGYSENTPGTLAVPIAQIIESAPFGRGIQFGVVEAKGHTVEGVIIDKDGKNAGNIGPGGPDDPGMRSLAVDRVFLGDSRQGHEVEAHNYKIDIGKGGMKPGEHGFNESVGYMIRTDTDVKRNQNVTYGTGENYPLEVHINEPWVAENKFTGNSAQEANAEAYIQQLQVESRNRAIYRDKYVVPLRSGMMEFKDEGGRRLTTLELRYMSKNPMMGQPVIQYAT